jgi:heme-degrading monooxygenase HmoA
MYATIRRYENDPGLADRLAERSDEIRQLMSGVAGFRSYHLVRSNDGTASVTICDDQAGTEESNRLAASWLKENMPDAVSAAPRVTAGEVVVDF